MKRGNCYVALLVLALAVPSWARAADPHIQTIAYDADTVVSLTGAMGWQIMIEFAEDERIENVSIGDSTQWQVTPNKRARMLFVKPLSRKASTNMTVVTSARQYAFNLSVAPRSGHTPWIVRFAYPPAALAVIVAEPVEPLPPPPNLDFAYAMKGDRSLLPRRVWDDGRQTYFEFAEETPMPAIFAGTDKDESIVNVSVRGRVAVVQQRASQFVLRSGKRSAIVSKIATRANALAVTTQP